MKRRQFLRGLGIGTCGAVVGGSATILSGVATDQLLTKSAARDDAGAHRTEIDWGTKSVIYSGPRGNNLVALSFDDGPNPEFTNRVLDILGVAKVKATFCVIGQMVEQHPDLLRRVADEGHEIGNHSWSHPDFTYISPKDAVAQIRDCADVVKAVCGIETTMFRPPRGRVTGAMLLATGELNHEVLMWSSERGPGDTSTASAVREHIADSWTDGRILDLHDGLGRANLDKSSRVAKRLRERRNVELDALADVLVDAKNRQLRVEQRAKL